MANQNPFAITSGSAANPYAAPAANQGAGQRSTGVTDPSSLGLGKPSSLDGAGTNSNMNTGAGAPGGMGPGPRKPGALTGLNVAPGFNARPNPGAPTGLNGFGRRDDNFGRPRNQGGMGRNDGGMGPAEFKPQNKNPEVFNKQVLPGAGLTQAASGVGRIPELDSAMATIDTEMKSWAATNPQVMQLQWLGEDMKRRQEAGEQISQDEIANMQALQQQMQQDPGYQAIQQKQQALVAQYQPQIQALQAQQQQQRRP